MNENEAGSEAVQPTRRRRHSKEFKETVVRAAMQPNVSIAAVALHYQLNANLLRRWVATQQQDAAREARQSMSVPAAKFVPLQW
ncbi:transposase [Mycetohabitans endofungorum]|nr:transposase [Mycetohabitans endofungorum]